MARSIKSIQVLARLGKVNMLIARPYFPSPMASSSDVSRDMQRVDLLCKMREEA